jgi:pyruvate/2-oxoglutarate dehydrogenase complex dihydrolipoamide dehydrogenase (E3) component
MTWAALETGRTKQLNKKGQIKMRKADAVILGFGKGGKTLAVALAAEGKNVVMVEQSDMMYGGTCINVACIPTKSLVHSAALSAAAGGSFEEKAARYEKAIEEKNRLTAMLRGKNFHMLADKENITVLTGKGAFTDAKHVHVELADGGSEDIEAEQFFINTGARPFVPPIPGLAESRYMKVSEGMMEVKTLPKKFVIIGGGYIGMEFASMYANFGSEVTVIQNEEIFLPREDAEVAEAVLKSITERGIKVLRSAVTKKVSDENGRAVLTVELPSGTQTIEADIILVAAGRRPNVSFAPEKAGIELTERGAVKTDEHLETSAPGIYAMGDIVGGLQFTYISLDDFRIVSASVLGGASKTDVQWKRKIQNEKQGGRTTANRGAVPYSVFLDPPFSRVGLTEKEAVESGYEVKIGRLPAAAIPKAHVVQKPTGMLKVVIDAKTNAILGAHLFCEESHEIINIIKLAIDLKTPYTVLRDNIYTHPTMAEAFNDLFRNVK